MWWIWIVVAVAAVILALGGWGLWWAFSGRSDPPPTQPGLNPQCYLLKQSCKDDPEACTKLDPRARCLYNPKTKAFQCCRLAGLSFDDFTSQGPQCGCTPHYCSSEEVCFRGVCAWPCSPSKPCPFSGTTCRDGVCQDT